MSLDWNIVVSRRNVIHQMEKMKKYCRVIGEVYRAEGVTSTKAAACRHKLLTYVREGDSSESDVLMLWRAAYHPVRCVPPPSLYVICAAMCGELLTLPPSALVFIFIGDLHRYMKSNRVAQIYYGKALHMDPNNGRILNQLSLAEDENRRSLRFLLLCQLSERPFAQGLQNLKNKLDEMSEKTSYEQLVHISTAASFNEASVMEDREKWLKGLREDGDMTEVHCVSLAAQLAVHNNRHDVVRFLADVLIESFLFLLSRSSSPIPRRTLPSKRRADWSSSGEDCDESSEEEEEETFEEDDDGEDGDRYSLLTIIVEFILSILTVPNMAGSLKEKFDGLLKAVVEHSNKKRILCAMGGLNGSDPSVPPSWLLSPFPSRVQYLCHFLSRLVSLDDSPILFTSFFVLRSSASLSLLRKMATLAFSENKAQMPKYIVLSEGTMEKRLGKVRNLLEGGRLIGVIPADELAMIDKRKGSSKMARDALRCIEEEQTRNVHVMAEGSVEEATRYAQERGPTVILTMTQSDQPSPTHIDTFCQLWRKRHLHWSS